MIRVTVSYPASPGKKFDMDYYLNRHIARTRKCYGDALTGFEVFEGTHGAGGGAPPVLVTGHFFFVSAEKLIEVAQKHNDELMADIPNYTDIEPMVVIETKRAAGGTTG